MNDTGNVFDASSSLIGSEEVPAHSDPFYEEPPTEVLHAAEEPDYFITEAPARGRRGPFALLRAPGLPRNRIVAVAGLLAGAFVVFALLGAAGGPEAGPAPTPAPTASAEPQIEEVGTAAEGVRMDRLLSAEAKRVRQAKLNAEAIAQARRREARVRAHRQRARKRKKARVLPRGRHAPGSRPAPEAAPEPEPSYYEPEATYYEPVEPAPSPSPPPTPSPAQEFGIEP